MQGRSMFLKQHYSSQSENIEKTDSGVSPKWVKSNKHREKEREKSESQLLQWFSTCRLNQNM